jgi:hypothetical protein
MAHLKTLKYLNVYKKYYIPFIVILAIIFHYKNNLMQNERDVLFGSVTPRLRVYPYGKPCERTL